MDTESWRKVSLDWDVLGKRPNPPPQTTTIGCTHGTTTRTVDVGGSRYITNGSGRGNDRVGTDQNGSSTTVTHSVRSLSVLDLPTFFRQQSHSDSGRPGVIGRRTEDRTGSRPHRPTPRGVAPTSGLVVEDLSPALRRP